MGESKLIRFLASNIPIVKNEIYQHLETFTVKKVKKGEIILRQGDICSHTYFVEKGLLRYYSIDKKGKENVL